MNLNNKDEVLATLKKVLDHVGEIELPVLFNHENFECVIERAVEQGRYELAQEIIKILGGIKKEEKE
jgi:hypothetical protein